METLPTRGGGGKFLRLRRWKKVRNSNLEEPQRFPSPTSLIGVNKCWGGNWAAELWREETGAVELPTGPAERAGVWLVVTMWGLLCCDADAFLSHPNSCKQPFTPTPVSIADKNSSFITLDFGINISLVSYGFPFWGAWMCATSP